MTQLALDLLQPSQPTLENFVTGRNAEVLAAVRALRDQDDMRFVYVWGSAGSGCSHLLRAVAAVASTVPEYSPERRRYAIDDVQSLSDAQQSRLFVLINEIRSAGEASLIVAGNAPPTALPLREDLRTRLAWGLVYQLHPLSDEEKAAALRQQAVARGMPLTADTIKWLLAHLPRDMRTLSAALDALDAYALARQRAVTVALAREWLNLRTTC